MTDNKTKLQMLMADAIRTTGSDDAAYATFEQNLEALRDAELLWSFIDPGVVRMLTRRLHGETKHSMTVAQNMTDNRVRPSAPSSSTSSVDSSADATLRISTGKKSTETSAAGGVAQDVSATHGNSRGAPPVTTTYPRQVVFKQPVRTSAKRKTQGVTITDNRGRNVKTMTSRSLETAVTKTAPHFVRFGEKIMNGMPNTGRDKDRTSSFYSDEDLSRVWKEADAAD